MKRHYYFVTATVTRTDTTLTKSEKIQVSYEVEQGNQDDRSFFLGLEGYLQ